MIQHVWSVFCSSSAIDRDTNQVSIFDVVDEISGDFPPFPPGETVSIPARFQLVTLWGREQTEASERGVARIRFVNPNSRELIMSPFDIDLSEHKLRRIRLNLLGIPYDGNGRYFFLTEVGGPDDTWTVVARIPVLINLRVPPVAAPQGDTEDEPAAPHGDAEQRE